MKRRLKAAVLSGAIGAAQALVGCGEYSTPLARFIERDSAGVTIVENRDMGWADVAPWRVGSHPSLSIGTENGAAPYRFNGIRGVYRLADSRFVVADGSRTIRVFDSSGTFLSSLGRDGDGPGEYRTISMVRTYGADSLVVWDFASRRVTVLSLDGGHPRVSQSPNLAGYFFAEDAFADGSLLGLMGDAVDLRSAQPGLLRNPATYVRYDIHAETLDTIAQCPGGESSYLRGDGAVFSVNFSPEPVAVTAGPYLYCGSGARFEIKMYGQSGDLRRIVRLDRDRAPLPREVVRDFVDDLARRQRTSKARERILADFADLPYPSKLPAYQKLLVDADANLWVAGYSVDDSRPARWTLFDARGRLIGGIETPGNFAVHQVGEDFVLGVATDSLGVEQVQEFRLSKGN